MEDQLKNSITFFLTVKKDDAFLQYGLSHPRTIEQVPNGSLRHRISSTLITKATLFTGVAESVCF